MKRLNGLTLGAVGILLGMTAALAFVVFKQWLVGELVEVLEDEVKKSCDCTLAFDSFHVSLSRRYGRARNVRILERGQVKLSFKEITADFDLSEITSKKVYIDNLILAGGNADGVGPKSVTFRFIDQLTTPGPDSNKPGKWKAVLNTLGVTAATFREPFPSSVLLGEGLTLQVRREGERFHLAPAVRDLIYRKLPTKDRSEPVDLRLGHLAASLLIDNGITTFDKLTVGRDISSISLGGTIDSKHGDQCTGTGEYSIDTAYLGLPEWMAGQLIGTTTLGSTIGSPILRGPVGTGSPAPLTMAFDNAPAIPFQSVNADLTVDVNHGDPVITVDNLRGTAQGAVLTSSKPFVFSDRGIDAGFNAHFDSFSYGPFAVAHAGASIDIEEREEGTITHFLIQAGDLQSQGVSLGPATIGVDLYPSKVEVRVDSTDARQGTFKAKGSVLLGGPNGPELRDGSLQLVEYRYPFTVPIDVNRLAPVAITTDLSLSGPLDLAKLKGAGPTSASVPALGGYRFTGTTELSDGILTVKLPQSMHNASTSLTVDLVRKASGTLLLNLPSTSATTLLGHGACGTAGGDIEYNFQIAKPLAGNGTVSLGDLEWGCPPYTVKVTSHSKLPISGGSVQFSRITVEGVNSSVAINGSVGFEKGYDLKVGGDLLMSSLLPFVRGIEDLQGRMHVAVGLTGALGSPTMTGTAALERGEVGIATPDITAREISGTLKLVGDAIEVNGFQGKVNSGLVALQGKMYPFEFARSQLDLTLTNITIEPIEDASVTFSGAIRLGEDKEHRQSLSGSVLIEAAEVSRDIDPKTLLVQAIAGYFVKNSPSVETAKRSLDIELNLAVKAPRNIFILTPIVSAELNAQLMVRGTATQPLVQGTMQVLSGWIAIKDNRFDITSGTAVFKPESLEPILDIASEGLLRNTSGENILVLLEASGPLRAPRITLSSDRGLTQDQLLLLLTSSRRLQGRTLANSIGRQLGTNEQFLLSSTTFSSFQSFIRSLTRIDSLSFEPLYNQYTGTLEPGVVGKKNIAERISLVGDSTFGTVSNSRAGVVYNLTPKLNVSTFAQSVSTRQNTALSVDLTYTILSNQPKFLDIEVGGLSSLEEVSLLSAGRIGPASRIKNTSESLATVERDLNAYLVGNGYLASSVKAVCVGEGEYCRDLDISVVEGPRFMIKDVATRGDEVPAGALPALKKALSSGDPALASSLQEAEDRLIIALRNEGYIAARVTGSFERLPASEEVTAVLNVDRRQPISFVFKGNKVFTAAEFLESIQLFTRKRPFGNNTIHLLVENIERMYQEKGYLFVRVTYSEDRSDPSRLTYLVDIQEEAPAKVNSLTITGNTSVPLKRIKSVMKELGFEDQVALLKPEFAVPGQLDSLKDILGSVYQQEGFTDAQISYEINQVDATGPLDIVFTIVEGPSYIASRLETHGAPYGVEMPIPPATPISLPRINQYIARVVDTLREEGYLFPEVLADYDPDSKSVDITIEPGVRTMVEALEFEGLVKVSEDNALRYTTLSPNHPYRIADVNSTKRGLLRSGLFSRVEIVPKDGTFDSPKETIIIRLTERPLDTLEVGTGANSEFGLHLFGEAVDKSVFADGRTLSLRLDSYINSVSGGVDSGGGKDISQGFASARYDDPALFNSEYSYSEELRFQRQAISSQEYDLERLSLSTFFSKPFDTGERLSTGHSILFDNLRDVNPDAIITPLDTGAVRLSLLTTKFTIDRRDDPLLPHSGYTFSLEPKLSLEQFGSQADFAELTSRATTVVPLDIISPRYSLGLGALAGVGQAFGDTDQIPITQRFYLGGRTTVRGFRELSLGPRGANGAVIGGNSMLAGSSQLQYLVNSSFSTHIFFDAGNVFLGSTPGFGSEIRTSTGSGFRYLSPIGPIGLDIGFPLDQKPGEPSVRLHFSVGSNF